MTIEQLRDVHQAQPFQPFTLELANGKTVHVPHPEFLSYYPRGRSVAVAVSEKVIKIIDVMLIASIQVGNGKPQRRKKGGNSQ